MHRLLILLLLAPAWASAQSPADRDVVLAAELQPVLIGGLAGLQRRVVYPEVALRDSVEGRVILQFVVATDGSAENPVVLQSPDDRLSEAALAAVLASSFVPARQGEQPVRARMSLPIVFRLRAPAPAVTRQPPELIGGLVELQRRTRYPNQARRMGIDGEVIVRLVVTTDGTARDATCVSGPHPSLCDSALRSVGESRFVPARENGRFVEAENELPVRFLLLN